MSDMAAFCFSVWIWNSTSWDRSKVFDDNDNNNDVDDAVDDDVIVLDAEMRRTEKSAANAIFIFIQPLPSIFSFKNIIRSS